MNKGWLELESDPGMGRSEAFVQFHGLNQAMIFSFKKFPYMRNRGRGVRICNPFWQIPHRFNEKWKITAKYDNFRILCSQLPESSNLNKNTPYIKLGYSLPASFTTVTYTIFEHRVSNRVQGV